MKFQNADTSHSMSLLVKFQESIDADTLGNLFAYTKNSFPTKKSQGQDRVYKETGIQTLGKGQHPYCPVVSLQHVCPSAHMDLPSGHFTNSAFMSMGYIHTQVIDRSTFQCILNHISTHCISFSKLGNKQQEKLDCNGRKTEVNLSGN